MFRNPSSEFVYVRTYSRWMDSEGRRESWPETVGRYVSFVEKHLGSKIPPKVMRKIEEKILAFEVMPSMRFLWAAGSPAELDNTTIYNCSFASINYVDAFAEALYVLMCGTGFGFSVENKYVKMLPMVPAQIIPNGQFLEVEDSKAGWADSLKFLINSLYAGQNPEILYNKIRPAGARLKTMGGRASGPGPLAQLHHFVKSTFHNARGRQLTSQECHDILCEIAQIVVVGGVRRSSEMSLSDLDDKDMRESKTGNFPVRRYMSNNSAVYNTKPDIVTFMNEWAALIASNSGERGIFNLESARAMAPKRRDSDKIVGTNPCKPLKSLILTPNGYINISQALELPSLLIVDPQGKVKEASKPFLTGHKMVKALTLSNGCKLYGTENHKHKVKDGEWTEIKDLNVGSKLEFSAKAVSSLDISDKETYEDGLVAGWIWADGWSFKRSDSETSYRTGMCFGVNEFDVAPLFEKLTGSGYAPHPQKPDTCKTIKCFMDPRQVYEKYRISKDKSDLTWLHKCDSNFKIGFIKSAFTADGSVRKHNGVELYSVNREPLETLSHTLREFGIYSTVVLHGNAKSYMAKDGKTRNNKACWKLNVYAGQFKKIGFLSAFKQNLLNEQESTKIYRYADYVSVVAIEDIGIEDVYDITVYSDEHSYVDGGVTTHNCGEIELRSEQFCNLSEVVARAEDDMDTMLEKIETATWMGVIQSCFTNFPYLGANWAKNCNEERLLGVSITGQFDAPHLFHKEALKSYKAKAIKVAKKASAIMGIPMPAAITCVKPSGTVSQLVDSASGIHPRFSKYYIRRYRISATDPLFKMVRDQGLPVSPENGQRKQDYVKAVRAYDSAIEKGSTIPSATNEAKSICPMFDGNGWTADKVNTWIVSFPVASPEKAIVVEDVNALEQLEYYKTVQKNWCEHNASITVYVKQDEWLAVADWVYKNWKIVNGISFLPVSDHVYEQAPYEKITKEEYDNMSKSFPKIDYSQLGKYELEDNTEGAKSLACSGGNCDI